LRIAAISRSRPDSFGIVVPAQSQLNRAADLAGRTVIVSSARGSITHYLLLEALREAGVKPGAVTIGFMLPNEAASAYETGKFDAWATFGVYLVRAGWPAGACCAMRGGFVQVMAGLRWRKARQTIRHGDGR